MKFGCPHCFNPEAQSAWEASDSLVRVSEIVSESHFIVNLYACSSCGQRFLRVFTEMINWGGGEDSQCVSLPLTPDECERVMAEKENFDPRWLADCARERRHLVKLSPDPGVPARMVPVQGGGQFSGRTGSMSSRTTECPSAPETPF
jgi:hypothetical protein